MAVLSKERPIFFTLTFLLFLRSNNVLHTFFRKVDKLLLVKFVHLQVTMERYFRGWLFL